MSNELLWGDRELARVWRPRSALQWAALNCPAMFMLLGGSAGTYKSETLFIRALRYRHRPQSKCVIFRKTRPELIQMISRAKLIYLQLGATYNGTDHIFTFPSGATVLFDYMDREDHEARQLSQEYDYIGFDESTRMKSGMARIRFMFLRLRSSDYYLQGKCQMILATNPGGHGNNAHRHIFIGPRCAHCAVHRNRKKMKGYREPGKIYYDATWPNGDPLTTDPRFPVSTVFIPGVLDAAGLLGQRYIASNLQTLMASQKKSFLQGCWDITEGQYFDIWDETKMVIRRQDIMDQWWWPHWVSIDYGFSGSIASAHLHCKSPAFKLQLKNGLVENYPDGRIFTIAEITREHMLAADFAKLLKEKWLVRNRRIQAWYASPDLWNDTGDGHQRADQMMKAANINLEQASNDRVGGAMLMYQLLRDGLWQIADSCEMATQAIPWAVHDTREEGDPDDVLKVKGEPLDDVYDDLRYGMYSYIGQAEKPPEVQIQEAITSTDPTGAMMQYRQAVAKAQAAEEPIILFRRGIGHESED